MSATVKLNKQLVNPVFDYIKLRLNDMVEEKMRRAAEQLRSGKNFSIELGVGELVLVRFADILAIQAPVDDVENYFYITHIYHEGQLEQLASMLEAAPLFVSTLVELCPNKDRMAWFERTTFCKVKDHYWELEYTSQGPDLYPFYRQA